jgi:hypothetical protein
MPLTKRVLAVGNEGTAIAAGTGTAAVKAYEGSPADILHKVHSMQLAKGLSCIFIIFFIF